MTTTYLVLRPERERFPLATKLMDGDEEDLDLVLRLLLHVSSNKREQAIKDGLLRKVARRIHETNVHERRASQ